MKPTWDTLFPLDSYQSTKPPSLLPDQILPPANWRPPNELINLGRVIAVDVETRDPFLKTRGPGFKYGEGEVVGIALSNGEVHMYLPIAHYGGDNLPKETVLRYVRAQLQGADEVVMANATYDLGWLDTLGLSVPGTIRDIQVAAALLDEHRPSYSLNSLALDYLGESKQEEGMEEICKMHGWSTKDSIWKLPARYVGPYAEQDARITYLIYQKQVPELFKEGLTNLWEIECVNTKVSFLMTKQGVRVDLDRAQQLSDELKVREKEILKQFPVNINSGDQLGPWLTEKGYCVPKTITGKPSVTKEWLEEANDPLLLQIREARIILNMRKQFVDDFILEGNWKGRIHSSFNQARSDESGSVGGRYSSTGPNMQQVPKRSEIGKVIRSLFIPEEGELWCKCDYSSQEPRIQVHYALILGLQGAKEAAEYFIAGKKLYDYLVDATGQSYDLCKAMTLAISYGQRVKSLSLKLGISYEEAEKIYDQFNKKVPFLKMLFDLCEAKASETGFIRTLLGRKCRFPHWEKKWKDYNNPLDNRYFDSYEMAQENFPGEQLTRAFTYRALNRLAQGSGADQTKKAMADMYKAGIVPLLPVHDEINRSAANEKECLLQKKIMEEAVTLKLPVLADMDIGDSWK